MEKKIARHLKKLQNDAHPNNENANEVPQKPKGNLNKLRSHIQTKKDWIFLLLLCAALMKDVYDLASAGFLLDSGVMDSASSGGGSIIAEIIQDLGETGAAALISWYFGGIAAIPVAAYKIIKWLWRIGKLYSYIKGLAAAFAAGLKLAAAILGPFIFNIMFLWLTFVALLLSGRGRFFTRWKAILGLMFVEFVAESFFGLDWIPGATIFTIILYRIVLKQRRKKDPQESPAPA